MSRPLGATRPAGATGPPAATGPAAATGPTAAVQPARRPATARGVGSARTSRRPAPVQDAERSRLAETKAGLARWERWGPYLAERQWGTVREDYSEQGDAWNYLPHDQARSRAYRWGEDGLLGICDDQARVCFALALWNERDPILKERLFGLTGPQGNHGEDVKELYWYLDATPSHSYLKAAYAYPQAEYPYSRLVEENARRGRADPEFDLVDTGVLDDGRVFDVVAEYAKAAPDDILIRLSVTNRGPDPAPLHLLPTIWFRNTWAWGRHDLRPTFRAADGGGAERLILGHHPRTGPLRLILEGTPGLLFTDNETNAARLWGSPNASPFVKDAFHRFVVDGEDGAINPDQVGSKAAAHYAFELAPGETRTVRLRLISSKSAEAAESAPAPADPFAGAEDLFRQRIAEADVFYAAFGGERLSADERLVQRQAFAGLIWTKQLYHYDVAEWLDGDPAFPPPPVARKQGRNADWRELNNFDVISMPDAWEYPWYAAWDLAFHCIPLAVIDPDFAKAQLLMLTREWYMHPNGQLPAYEWRFGDVNPPVHAWATYRVYKIDRRVSGTADRGFLERVFHKLLLNFTWWVNRKDAHGHNVFQGGFLGLDNIGVFDRSAPLPTGGHLGQADGTAWMGMFCLSMLAIAIELAREDIVYEDIATKFLEHFLYIAGALNDIGGTGLSLWDAEDEFFYDVLHLDSGETIPLKVRSLVGLIPLLAVETLEPSVLQALPGFRRRLRWFLANRPQLARLVASWDEPGLGERRLLALVHGHRMKALLRRMLDPNEFLSDHGVRSLSRHHLDYPYTIELGGMSHTVAYEPAESRSGLFGGNSNWRGPVWFPINYLLIEALQKFGHYYGDDFRVELPTGSGRLASLDEVAAELSARLNSIFLLDSSGRRPVFGPDSRLQPDPADRDRILFYEYFNGDTAEGAGASHQTGWTALTAKLLEQAANLR